MNPKSIKIIITSNVFYRKRERETHRDRDRLGERKRQRQKENEKGDLILLNLQNFN